jgi:hypothetical protein
MNLSEMITLVRKDLRDQDSENYRWTDDELTRHINRAVREFSEEVPLPARATLPTASDSREVDISSLTGRVMVEAVEYPLLSFPPDYQQFTVWGDTLTIISGSEPDGSNCYIYYGKLHTMDAGDSTIPTKYEDIVAGGACGYAAVEWAVYAVNRVNIGGTLTSKEYLEWGNQKLNDFRRELKRLGRKNRVRISSLYQPYHPVVNQSSDYGAG